MANEDMNYLGINENNGIYRNQEFEEILKSAKKVTIDEQLSDDAEVTNKENIWTKSLQENSVTNDSRFNLSKTVNSGVSPFTFAIKAIMPPDGDYHFVLKYFNEELNSVKAGGYVTSYCSFDFSLLSVDGIEYDLKQVFSSKELSLKKFQMFVNSLLLSIGVNEITNPQELIGCTGECRVVNSVNDDRRYVNISTIIQATLPQKK